MTPELFLLGLLAVLLLVTQVFWAKVCFDLHNRLMSRNYYEFEQAQALKIPKAPTPPADSKESDFEAERQAQGANSLLGMI